jgi:hypothetical protein
LQRACDDLGLDYPREVQEFTSESERLQVIVTLNTNRRRWNRKKRRGVVAAYLKLDPAINDNHLGQIVGVSQNTVARVRTELETTFQIEKFDKRRGQDGKQRPAKYRRIIANNATEAEQAREVIKDLPPSCEGKLLDVTTAARRARRHASKQEWEGQIVVPSADENVRLYHCPFQGLEAAAGIVAASVHAIITDILYDEPFLPQVSELAELASRILVPGGLLVTLSGTLHLDQVMKRLGERLEWGWKGESIWDGNGNVVHQRQVMSQCKPILVYSNGPWKERGMWPDVFRVNSKEKDWHPMQQPLEEVESLVRYFTQPNDLVVDPCGGSFTVALACRNLGRRFIGCDLSAECVSKGQARLAGLSAADWARANQAEPERHDGTGKE